MHTFDSATQTLPSGTQLKQKIPPLLVNINGLHFKDNFRANTFAAISTEPLFQSGPTTPAVPPANQTPNTPVMINDITNLIGTVLPGAVAAQQTSPLSGNQMQQTGNIINPVLLPPEGQQRLEKGKQNIYDSYILPNKRDIPSTLQFPIPLSILPETL